MKFSILLFVLLGSLIFFPLISLAGSYEISGATYYYQGFVPCGVTVCSAPFAADGSCPGTKKEAQNNRCQLCHLFVMFDGIIDFLLVNVLFPLAVLMIVIAGVLYAGAVFEVLPGGFQTLTKAKGIIFSVALGLIIIFAAFILVGFFLKFINLADWAQNIYKDWSQGLFKINCQIKLTPP